MGLRFAIAGDVMYRTPLRIAHEPACRQEWFLEKQERSHLSVANLEMALSARGTPADKLIQIRNAPEMVADLRRLGFDAVTLANNHMMDYGPVGLEDTLAAIDRVGLRRAGAGMTWEEATAPAIIDTSSGEQVHLINFACTLPPNSAAGRDRPGVAPTRVTTRYEVDPVFMQDMPGAPPIVDTFVTDQDARALLDQVSVSRRAGAWVVVFMHWGVTPHWLPPLYHHLARYQRELAIRIVQAGAHAIVGHHPHILHPIEVIDGCPVLYSIGNFIWHPRPLPISADDVPHWEPGYRQRLRQALVHSASDRLRRESVFVEMELDDAGAAIALTPVWIGDDGEPRRADPSCSLEIAGKLKRMSRVLGTDLDAAADGVVSARWARPLPDRPAA